MYWFADATKDVCCSPASRAEMSLTTMARRVKDGLLMRMYLMDILCLSPIRPDGQEAAQMLKLLPDSSDFQTLV